MTGWLAGWGGGIFKRVDVVRVVGGGMAGKKMVGYWTFTQYRVYIG